jgi:hypothetical protein
MVRAAVTVLAVVLVAACGGDDRAIPGTRTTLTALAAPGTTQAATTTTDQATTSPSGPRRGRLVVSATGDVNLDPGYIPELATQGYAYPWSGLRDVFVQDALTVVNLECAASDLGEPEPKGFVFRCDPDGLDEMAAAGVDVANLGNNHSGDYGKEALVDSVRQVEANGMAAVGAGADAERAHRAALFDIDGWTVAVVGFGGVYPTLDWFATEDRPGMADGDTVATMVAAVEAADALADIVLVTIHWGVELDTAPRPDDRRRAAALVAAGADAIFGHHAHRLQPLEMVDGVPVFWGLGNFVWPINSPEGATTGIAQVVFRPDGGVTACLLPVIIERPGHPVLQVEYRPGRPCAGSEVSTSMTATLSE